MITTRKLKNTNGNIPSVYTEEITVEKKRQNHRQIEKSLVIFGGF
jgi:hypothetical protein